MGSAAGAAFGSYFGGPIGGYVAGQVGGNVGSSVEAIASGRGSTEDYVNTVLPLTSVSIPGIGSINSGVADAVDWVGGIF